MVDNKTILLHICVKDRPTEIALLLESLRHSKNQNFNIIILDDGSSTPLGNFYFIIYLIQRMKIEGHYIEVIRNNFPSGVSKARQQLIDYSLKNRKEKFFLRIDDDSLVTEDYLDKLLEVIDNGYDIASGVVPIFVGPDTIRNVKNVEPIIGEVQLNEKGEIMINQDSCGMMYLEEKILPSHQFRSCALFKREIFENGIDYNSRLSKNGFREEEILAFKCILKGYKIGINTHAICWHLNTPSGGERDTMQLGTFNQQILEETTKRMFEENGNFIEKYNEKLGIKTKVYSKEEILKSTNLVFNKPQLTLKDIAE